MGISESTQGLVIAEEQIEEEVVDASPKELVGEDIRVDTTSQGF